MPSKGEAAEQLPSRTPAVFVYKIYRSLSCKFLSHWTIITQEDLQLNWPTWAFLKSPS